MTLHHDDGNTPRPGLRAVGADEPPFDPEYDRPADNRHPPFNMAAEQAVLGALILEPRRAPDLAHHLDAADFYQPRHEQIWNAIQAVAGETTGDVQHDSVTLISHLAKTGHLPRVGGAPYLHELTAACPTPDNALTYAADVRDHARMRAAFNAGTQLLHLASTGDVTKVDAYMSEAVQALDDAAMRYGARPTPSGYKDLSWILTGQPPQIPPPAWVQHTAGHALFYAGKVNGVFGDPETAKTWLAQCALVEALNSETGTAAMIDVDHNGENHTAARLMLLGAHPAAIADPDRFRYYDPQDGDELHSAITDVTTHHPDVFLLDSLGEVFPLLGINSNDGDEITAGLRLISRPAESGSCVIFIDHLPKSTEARSTGFAIGSIAKKRAVRGSYIRAEERTKPAPGQIGRISLFIEKDTAGELRRATPGGKYLGTFVLDSTTPDITTWRIEHGANAITQDGRFRPTHLMEQISRYIEDNDQCSQRDIREAINSKTAHITAAITCLIDEGFVHVLEGKNRAKLHHSISLYREAEDDNPTLDI